MSSSLYSKLLKKYLLTKETFNPATDKTMIITNTRIGDKTHNIHGGSYCIPDEKYMEFLECYYEHVFKNGNAEYLTEKQMGNGAIAIDIDLRHTYETQTRQYTTEHIMDLMALYLDKLREIYVFEKDAVIESYIYQKTGVNRIENKNITKDGLHIIIGISADRKTQLALRSKVIREMPESWNMIEKTNTWEDVFDSGISAGSTNWQLYGSKKPNHEAYKLTMGFRYLYDEIENDFEYEELDINKMDELFPKMSVRYSKHPKFLFTPQHEHYLSVNDGAGAKIRTPSPSGCATAGAGAGARSDVVGVVFDTSLLSVIRTREDLEYQIGVFLDSLTPDEYKIREAHEYTMILPSKFYKGGSYDDWVRVAWVLRNIDDRLFLTWVYFSAQSPEFSIMDIHILYDKWITCDLKNKNGSGLTERSLLYWAKENSPADFARVQQEMMSLFIDQKIVDSLLTSFGDNTKASIYNDHDMAIILHQLFKTEYVCANVGKNLWYRFRNHRWEEIDSGVFLSREINNTIQKQYILKQSDYLNKLISTEEGTDENKSIKLRISKIAQIIQKLGSRRDKQNILAEAKELFYDPEFYNNLDTNPYLLCFNNGVIDFTTKKFRAGVPEDYISKSTRINYTPQNPEYLTEIEDFMNKLFPIPELNTYMWHHLASTLLGTCQNQTFNMYVGCGQNGKSALVNLMEMSLGEYKGDVPLTMLTQQRIKVGGLAPELVALKGVRYAVMQEPSKGDKINEGIMKQVTSGMDTIQCRAPFMVKQMEYKPQFDLVVCTNTLMEIKSNDHGTWRRIRVCDFMSLFTDNPDTEDKERPHQFKIDKSIIEKFAYWKETFMSRLVEIAFETNGIVKNCDIVMQASNKYRQTQDHIAEFLSERIQTKEGKIIKKTDLSDEFKAWFTTNYDNKTKPQIKELHEAMNRIHKFSSKLNCWINAEIICEINNNEFMDVSGGKYCPTVNNSSDDDEDEYNLDV